MWNAAARCSLRKYDRKNTAIGTQSAEVHSSTASTLLMRCMQYHAILRCGVSFCQFISSSLDSTGCVFDAYRPSGANVTQQTGCILPS